MKKKLLLAIAAAFALTTPLVQAASDYLLEIDGIKGEYVDATRTGAIEIQSWSWGVSNTGGSASGGGGGAGKVSLQDFHFSCKGGKATPQLMLACATGKHFPKVELVVRKSDEPRPTYIKITMSDCIVTSVSQSGGGSTGAAGAVSDPRPTEQVSLNFTKITYEHISDDGTSETATVDTSSNTAGN